MKTTHRLVQICAVGLALAAFAHPADAQVTRRPDEGRTTQRPPPPPPTRQPTLEELFERLGKAKDEAEGKGVAGRIERLWSRSKSDTANLLMARALRVMSGKDRDLDLALELLDRIVELQPDWAEAFNRRATVFYLLGDMSRAVLDVRKTIALEPRHFGAYAGLGHILLQIGENRQAMDAYLKALEIHPQMDVAKKAVEKLRPQVGGVPT